MKLRYRTTYRARSGHLVVIPDGAKIRPISNYGTLDDRAIYVRLSPVVRARLGPVASRRR